MNDARDVPGRRSSHSNSIGVRADRWFGKAAARIAHECGRAHTFVAAFVIVAAWGASGPYFRFSDTWQLVINTGTTIVTFLMVFLLQNTQNRDSAAIQVKLDELIRVTERARNELMRTEDQPEEIIAEIKADLTGNAIPVSRRQAEP